MNSSGPSYNFEDREAWRSWLFANHALYREFWLIYYKKSSGKKSIVYREALEEALCFGWIDGIVKGIDEDRYMQRFTPRRERSKWSETNIRLCYELVTKGRMHEAGLRFREVWENYTEVNVARAKMPGIPPEFEAALKDSPEAYSNYSSLPPSAQKQYLLWITYAKKEETRARRISESISLLINGEKLGLK